MPTLPVNPIPIGTPVALEFIAAALAFLPTIIGAGNVGDNHQAIQDEFQHIGAEIVGILNHHHDSAF